MRKISFLVAAHNEERLIGNALNNLLHLPYNNYEVLIGLDGCTDQTEHIVRSYERKSKKFRHFLLKSREGKNEVVNILAKKAKGEILIIHDADWIFKVEDSNTFKKFVSVFNNSKVGGVAEAFPIEWDDQNMNQCNVGYKLVAYSSHYWLKFQREKLTMPNPKGGYCFLKEPTMFLTNILLKKLYMDNVSLGDDFERTRQIMNSGYQVVLFDTISMPRMIASYTSLTLNDLFKQKFRTAIARRQIVQPEIGAGNLGKYYVHSLTWMLRKSYSTKLSHGIYVSFWIAITAVATLLAQFTSLTTKEGWRLRARR